MKAPSRSALEGLVVDVRKRLNDFRELIEWLHVSDYAVGCESEISFDADDMLERGENLLKRSNVIFLEYQEDNPKWHRKAQSQFLSLTRYLTLLNDRYDELEFVRSLRQEALEGGNPFLEPEEEYKNPLETFWTDELACANSIRPKDDTD